MELKRDGLAPIGEALSGLDGPVKKALQPSPQARHHFTQADQVNTSWLGPAKRPRIWASWRG